MALGLVRGEQKSAHSTSRHDSGINPGVTAISGMMGSLFRPGCVAFLLSFVVYLVFLCPDVAWDDSGEFVTAGRCLGVPHAPGSPLVVILARIFTLAPIGSVAVRVNLLSALATSISVLLLCVLIGRLLYPRRNAGSTALLLAVAWAVSPWVMRHALAAEVYGPAWACFLGALLLAEEYQRRDCHAPCSVYVLWGLLAGIGASTSALLVPFALILCIVPFVDRRGFWVPVSRLVGGFFLGLLPLALPLLRSASQPPLYHTDTNTVLGLGRYLLGKQFERQIFQSAKEGDFQTWLWAGAGLLVLVLLLRKSPRPRRAWWIAGIGLLNLSFVVFQRHPGHFFVPWLCSVLLLAAVAWPPKLGRVAAVSCVLAAGLWSCKTPSRTQDLPLRWIGRTTLKMPTSSTVFLGEINAVFPLLYSAVVQREPPDFVIYPIWNSTRSERLEQLRLATGPVFVDMDLVDFAKRTAKDDDIFSSAVPDPILLTLRPSDSMTWETWWDSEREWLRLNEPRMTRLDRSILGKHYFNLGIFCMEHGMAIGETLLGLARGLNPELPQIGHRPS